MNHRQTKTGAIAPVAVLAAAASPVPGNSTRHIRWTTALAMAVALR